MADVWFAGMRGTGDWVTDQRPLNWREMILRLYPNGSAPLTALMSKMRSEVTDDPCFNWWEKELPDQTGTLTSPVGDYGLYSNANLTDPLTNTEALATGGTFYASIGAGVTAIDKFKVNHAVTFLDASAPSNYVNGLVTAIGATYVTCRCLGGVAAGFLGDIDTYIITGTLHGEGADTPEAMVADPTKYYNYTNIARNSLDMTRTAKFTRLRTGDHVQQAKIDCMELHSIEMERQAIWGERYEGTDPASPSKKLRSTGGLLYHIATNVFDYAADESVAWLTSGERWLDESLEQTFRFGSQEKLALCGSGAILGINQLVKNRTGATWDMTQMKGAYGIKVIQWTTPFGTIYLKNHPLLTQTAATRNMMLVADTKFLVYRYLTGSDTKYLPNRQGNGVDGEKSEYLTEWGLEVHFEKAHAVFYGVGLTGA